MDQQKNRLRREYLSRIHIVQDYIDQNVGKAFTLQELSEISGFSKYHFHRIFTSLMGETLYGYITRQKLERAAANLMIAPHKTITQIAMDFGFGDATMFARAFKKHYGISATVYRSEYSNNRKAQSNQSQAPSLSASYNEDEFLRRQKTMNNCKIEVTPIDEMTVLYLRHTGTYAQLGQVFGGMIDKLATWAGAQGLLDANTKILAVYHDNPDITEDDKLRTSICVTVPKGTKATGDFGSMAIPAGKYAIGHFECDDVRAAQQHSEAWSYFYGQWLPESGFEPDDGPFFEVYVNDPQTHPEKKHFVDIYLPVKPM